MDIVTRIELIILAVALFAGSIVFVRAQLADLARMKQESDRNAEFMRWVGEEYLPEYCRQHGMDYEQVKRDAEALSDTSWR